MRTHDFDYHLPKELIAQRPLAQRSASRLLRVLPEKMGGAYQDLHFQDLPSLLTPGDLLIFNNTRVFPARLYGQKRSGGRIEILIERILDQHEVIAHLRSNHTPRPGAALRLNDGTVVHVIEPRGPLFRLRIACPQPVIDYLERAGQVPLPPYITRNADVSDHERYQTLYAKHTGAVAAPTAGLHFDQNMLNRLQAQGVELGFVTLHVGAGTFQPVRTEYVQDHRMHAEYVEVSTEICEQIAATHAARKRVIAVGTTVIRCLETAASSGELQPFAGETNLFITPGYRFRCVDALITNFHLPRSSLLMLICAFSGYRQIMQAYQYAISRQYRFLSYGDAMFIEKLPAD